MTLKSQSLPLRRIVKSVRQQLTWQQQTDINNVSVKKDAKSEAVLLTMMV